jgi:hypothetical protein
VIMCAELLSDHVCGSVGFCQDFVTKNECIAVWDTAILDCSC